METRGDGQGGRVKHRKEGRGGEKVVLQLPLSQFMLQHHIFQLFVCKRSSLPHPGADGGAHKVCLVTLRLLRPARGVVLWRHSRFDP